MSIDTHEEPWLREALTGLVAHEPPMDPTLVADVLRGQVARAAVKRRRTAALAIAAVLAVVAVPAGLVLRSAVIAPSSVPAATSAPQIEGVSQAWLDAINPALLDQVTYVVDWPSSTVSGTAASGLLLDLNLVPVELTISGGTTTVTKVPVTSTARITLRWIPGSDGPGPALAQCPKSACPEYGATAIVGGPLNTGATAGPAAAFPEGTAILDSADARGLLEIVSYPPVATPGDSLPDDPRSRRALLSGTPAYLFLATIGNPVTGPPGPPPSPSIAVAQRRLVEPLLAGFGFTTTSVSLQPVSWGDGRTQVTYLAKPAGDTDGLITVTLVIGSFPQGAPDGTSYPTGSYLSLCTSTSCDDVRMTLYDCVQGALCPTETWTTVRAGHAALPEGAVILALTYPSSAVIEGVATPPDCPTCNRTPSTEAFLTEGQLRQVLAAIGDPLAATAPRPTASGSPLSSASTSSLAQGPCQSSDMVVSVVEDAEGGLTGERSVALEARARDGESCVLQGTPTVWLLSGSGSSLALTTRSGGYLGEPFASAPVTVTSTDAAVSVVATARCDAGTPVLAERIMYGLPGDRVVGVSTALIPAPLRGVGWCEGGPVDQTVWVSPFHVVR